MTTTMTKDAGLAGMTRAQLLEICREKGHKATGWKRDQMLAVLESGEAPAAKAKPNVLAAQMEQRETNDQAVLKAREHMLARTGRCVATVCRAACQSYEAAGKDAFNWQLCDCGHTQWAHAQGE